MFNGFAAELTEAQAQKLAQTPGVLAVSKDQLLRRDTSSTPAFLGLSTPGGLWTKAKGEGVVIGVPDVAEREADPGVSYPTAWLVKHKLVNGLGVRDLDHALQPDDFVAIVLALSGG